MFDIDNLPFDTGNPDKRMSIRDCVLLMAKETPDKLADTVENIINEHHTLLKKVAQNSTSNNKSCFQLPKLEEVMRDNPQLKNTNAVKVIVQIVLLDILNRQQQT